MMMMTMRGVALIPVGRIHLLLLLLFPLLFPPLLLLLKRCRRGVVAVV